MTYAGPITISNVDDFPDAFQVDVDGRINHPVVLDFHRLIDIPDTPWISSASIFELPGLTADTLAVSWTIEHVKGPHANDVNPNPNEPVTLRLAFTPATSGGFSTGTGRMFIEHPVNDGGDPHLDELRIIVSGTAVQAPGYLAISRYFLSFVGDHCTKVDPATAVCPEPAMGGGTTGGMRELKDASMPEPPPVVLLSLGLFALAVLWLRRFRLARRHSE